MQDIRCSADRGLPAVRRVGLIAEPVDEANVGITLGGIGESDRCMSCPIGPVVFFCGFVEFLSRSWDANRIWPCWHVATARWSRSWLTATPPAVWKYHDGSDFYSPSSIHRLIRHSMSLRLYWLGNISATPSRGSSPRYPLVIAEADEMKAALRKGTVTVIDDRQPPQSDNVQFSNFSLLEDRQSHLLELHLTTYGQQPDPADWATADNYKYFLKTR